MDNNDQIFTCCNVASVSACNGNTWCGTFCEQEERRAEMLAETQAVAKKEDQQQVKHLNVEILSEV